jgi:cell wall-active antibiotic response 4TMS protein YvqF
VREASPPGTTRNRTSLGLVLVIAGLLLALDSAGVLRTDGLGRWWPLLLIGVGFVKVRQPREDGQRAAGVAFLMLGGLFLFTTVLAIGAAWPLLMVAFGTFLIWQGAEGPVAETVKVSDSPYLSEMVLIGVVKRGHRPLDFRGGSVTAVIGGVELDLRKANLTGTAYLDVVAFWGGIEVKVPADWTVDARVIPLMGAFENKVDSPATPGGPRLVVRGHAIMGAVVIGH